MVLYLLSFRFVQPRIQDIATAYNSIRKTTTRWLQTRKIKDRRAFENSKKHVHRRGEACNVNKY